MTKAGSSHEPQGATVSWSSRALQIAGLWALAVAQPLFDLLARQPEALVAHDLGSGQLVAFAALLALGPPAVAGALLAINHRLAPPLAHVLGTLMVSVLSAALTLLVLRRITWLPPGLLVAIAIALGLLVARAAGSSTAVRTAVSLLAVASVICPIVFLASPSLRSLVRPTDPGLDLGSVTLDEAPVAGAPVVMVLFDEWPLVSVLEVDRTINAARYPNLARLAKRAHWFRNATTVAHSTAYAVPAVLSGRYPDARRLPVANDYPVSLFTLLAGAGYAMNVVEPHTDVCPESLCAEDDLHAPAMTRTLASDLRVIYLHLIAPQAWRDRLPTIGESWSHFTGQQDQREAPNTTATDDQVSKTGKDLTQRGRWKGKNPKRERAFHNNPAGSFRTFVERIDKQTQPALHFLHVMLPHMPWRTLPDGHRYESVSAPREPHGLVRQLWKGTAFEALQGQQRHLLQVASTDKLLGELIDRLEAQDLFDETLIVIVADHGTGFQVGRLRRNLTVPLIADITNVPLLIKMPHQETGTTDDRNAETIDIVPTLMQALGVPVETPLDGRNLLASPPTTVTKQTFRSGLAGAGPGRPLQFDIADLESQRQQRVNQIFDDFGRLPREVFAIGDFGTLVGKRLTTLTVQSEPATIRSQLDQQSALEQVDLDAPQIPARLTGLVRSVAPSATSPSESAPYTIALVVNGVVRAVTESHLDGEGQERFSAMIESRSLRAGHNRVALLEVSGSPEQPLLAPISLPQADPFQPFEAGFEHGDLSEWPNVSARGVGGRRTPKKGKPRP